MQTEQLTYAQLEYLLTSLGYRLISSPSDAHVFAYLEYDAVSVLPCINGAEPARPHHLITLRKVATEKGIVDEEAFERLLNQARQQVSDPLVKAS